MRMSLSNWRMLQESKMQGRPKRERSMPTGRKASKYVVSVDGRSIEVLALTKSEARSIVKKQLRLGRLPAGTVVEKVG